MTILTESPPPERVKETSPLGSGTSRSLEDILRQARLELTHHHHHQPPAGGGQDGGKVATFMRHQKRVVRWNEIQRKLWFRGI